MLAQAPRAGLPAVALPVAEDHREDERDVEADHGDRRPDQVAGVRVPVRRDHQREREHADREHGVPRNAVRADAPPGLVAGDGAVAREREHHPRRRGDRGGETEHLRDAADEQQDLRPRLAHRRLPDVDHRIPDRAQHTLVAAGDGERHGEQEDPAEHDRDDDGHVHADGGHPRRLCGLLSHVRGRVEAGDRVLRHQQALAEHVPEHEDAEVVPAEA